MRAVCGDRSDRTRFGVVQRPCGGERLSINVEDRGRLKSATVAALRTANARFRNDVLTGPGGRQVLLLDPSGNVVELFQAAQR